MLIGKNRIIAALRKELSAPALSKAFGKFAAPHLREARQAVRSSVSTQVPRSRVKKPAMAHLSRGIYSKVTPVSKLKGDLIYYSAVRGKGGRGSTKLRARHLHLVVLGTSFRRTKRGFYRGYMKKTYPLVVSAPGNRVIQRAQAVLDRELARIVDEQVLAKIQGA